MFCRISNKQLFKISFIIGLILFFSLSHLSSIHADEDVAAKNPTEDSQTPGDLNGKAERDKGQLTPNNDDEIILSIGQWRLNNYVDIRVPVPASLVLAESDTDTSHPRLRFVSNLDDWHALDNEKSDQPFTNDLLLFDISTYRLSSLEDAQAQIQLVLRDEALFFGDIPDTCMGYKAMKNSGSESIDLYGYTKIDTEYVGVFISYISQNLSEDDLDVYKKMMENYFSKLRKMNSTPLVTYERKPVKRCAIPGGQSVGADGETIFIFRDCVPGSVIMKKIPAPVGFSHVATDGQKFSKFRFVSDIEKWEKYEKREPGENFLENLIILDVAKYPFFDNENPFDDIINFFADDSGKINAFGDLPDSYMVYHSFPSPVCSVNLMGYTKIRDEYVQVFAAAWHGCLSADIEYEELVKKMMLDYMKKIREVNKVD